MGFVSNLVITSIIIYVAIKIFKFFVGSGNGKNSNGKSIPGPGILTTIQQFNAHKTDLHILLTAWRETYGNVFLCSLVTKKLLFLNDYKSIRETFISNPDVQGRPELAPANPFRTPKMGIIRNDGDSWSFQRKVSLRHLKNFGFGTGGKMEKLMTDEIMELVEFLDSQKGRDVQIKRLFFFHTMNAVWIVMAGLRLTSDEEDLIIRNKFLDFFRSLEEIIANPFITMLPSFVDYFPWIPSWKKYTETATWINKFLKKLINEHKERMNESDGEPEDFIFAYLKSNCLDQDGKQYNEQAIQQLETILLDFVFAGFETSSTQLEWVIYYMVRHPEWQVKIQEELDRVLGKQGRLPTIADRPKLPHVEAFILETMRMSPIVAIGVFHEATADTKISGFDVPKGTTIISNIYGAHHDESAIKNHESFQPERFLNEDASAVVYHPYLIPFSVGKRFCLGEFVAKDSMFLIVSAIFTKFHVRPPSVVVKYNETHGGMLLTTGSFQAQFERR